jgi:hypothetical protein
MNITITIEAPEVVGAVNNLSAAITNILAARAEAVAAAAIAAQPPTKPVKPKLAPVVQAATATPPTLAAAAVPRTIDEVKTLAALKAKKVGAAVIKGLIADTGSTQIADIADPHVLASLAANLDAL